MNEYTSFATVYDKFMDNIPYPEWASYIEGILKDDGILEGLVLELGCGTGNITELLCQAGYDMIGVDLSEEMLAIAKEKAEEKQQGILYLLQDMREFELYGTVKAVISVCDSMNYILESEDLLTVFKLVNNYLDPKGLFIFDLNTPYKYKEILGENTFAESREDGAFIWDNYYDDETRINDYELTLFIEENEDNFRRYQEVHYQKAHDLLEVKTLLEEAGMEFVAAYDAFTMEPPKEDSERVYIIARECGK